MAFAIFFTKIMFQLFKNADVQDPRQPDDNLYWSLCSGMEEEDRSDTHSGSGLSSQSGGSGPGSGGQWWPVVSGSQSQPHPAPEPELTWAAWSLVMDTRSRLWHKHHQQCDANTKLRLEFSNTPRDMSCLLSYQNMCWRTKVWRIENFSWRPEDESASNDDKCSPDSASPSGSELLCYIYKKFEVKFKNK